MLIANNAARPAVKAAGMVISAAVFAFLVPDAGYNAVRREFSRQVRADLDRAERVSARWYELSVFVTRAGVAEVRRENQANGHDA